MLSPPTTSAFRPPNPTHSPHSTLLKEKPEDDKPKAVVRPYTPTSPPDAKGYMDLVVKVYPQVWGPGCVGSLESWLRWVLVFAWTWPSRYTRRWGGPGVARIESDKQLRFTFS